MIFQTGTLLILGIIPLVLIFPTIALTIFFFVRYSKTQQNMLLYLGALFVFYLTNNILEMNQYFVVVQEVAELYFIVSEISYILLFYLLIVIFEVFYRNTQFSRRQTLITIIAFVVIGGLISNSDLQVMTLSQGYIVSIIQFSPIMILELVFFLTATALLLSVLIKTRKSAWDPKQKNLITWLLIGSIIGVLWPSLPFVLRPADIVVNESIFLLMQLIMSIPQNIGILIIGLAFLRVSNNPWLLQRQRIDFLVVYSHGGTSLFSKSFRKEIKEHESILLAGAFSAVSTLIEESTETTGNIKAIKLEGKELRVISREEFICTLLVEYTTQASEWAQNKFTLEFEKKFKQELTNFQGEITPFSAAEDLVVKFFS